MREKRKPISQTNMFLVILVAVIMAPLFSAAAESMRIFLYAVLTIPIVIVILFLLWLKYGFNGIHLNTVNCFVMFIMMSVYSSIPLFRLIWDTWAAWFIIGIHLVTFLIGYINREKLTRKIAGVDEKGNKQTNKSLLYYYMGVIILGIAGIIILNLTIESNGGPLIIFAFIHILFYYLFAISPVFLIHPDRVLEMGAISRSHYDVNY